MKDKRVDELKEGLVAILKAVESMHRRQDLVELTVIELLKHLRVGTRVYKEGEEIVRVELVELDLK